MAHSSEDQHKVAANFVNPKNSNSLKPKQELPTREYLLNKTSILSPRQMVGDCYEVIKSLERNPSITTYIVSKKQDQQSPLLVLELIYDLDSSIEAMTEEDFLQQIALIKKLSTHVQIPKLLDYVIDHQRYYVVYEYISGEVLSSIMQSRTLNEAEIINLVQDMARIYDFLIKSNLEDCHLLPCNILKSQVNNRYILGNLKELFRAKLSTTSLTMKQQSFLFHSQLDFLGNVVIQSLTKQNIQGAIVKNKIPLNWYQEINLSPRLQNILTKMISNNKANCYHSLPQIVDDFKPLLKINQLIRDQYRLIRYLGAKSGIQTYLARNINTVNINTALLIVKQLTVHHQAVVSGSVLQSQQLSNKKIDYLEQEVTKIKYSLNVKELDFVREVFEDREELYLVRAYSEGESLTKRLNQQNNFTVQEVIVFLENALKSLDIIHQQGLIHRNIKPSNLILSNNNQTVTLVDFGILQTINDSNERIQYHQGRKPPEQIVGRPTISSDLYALGVVAIEALTGLSIREIPQDSSVGKLIWREKLTSHPFLIEIIEKMICLDVDKRYQSAGEVLQDLSSRKKRNQEATHKKEANFSKSPKKANLKRFSVSKILVNFTRKGRNIGFLIAFITCLLTGLEVIFPTVRPQYYVYRGQQQLENKPAMALTAFNQALRLNLNKRIAWQGKGDALLALHHYQPALEAYGEAITLSLDSVNSWQGQGDAYYHLGDLQQALNAYNQALKIQPDHGESLARKGKILYLLSRYQEALPLQEQALTEKSGNDLELISDSALTAIALGKYHQALILLTRVQDTSPLQPNLWQDKVKVLNYLNRSSEALETAKLVLNNYEQALSQQPENLTLWLGKAAFLRQWKRDYNALNAYEQAIAIEPDSDLGWLGKSKVLLDMKQYPEALVAVNRALEIKPQSFLAWHTRGLILQQEQQNLAQAVAAYDQAIAINQDFFPSWRDRSSILIQQQDYSQAIKSLQKAVTLAPQDLESWLNLSDALQSSQKIEEAVKAIDQVIALQPRNSQYWLKKGSLWEIKQQYTKACDIYRQAMKIAPDLKISGAMERVGCKL